MIHYSLKSSKCRFKKILFSGIQISSLILNKGNNNAELQELALNIFKIILALNIILSVFWIPRKYSIQADALSKNVHNWVTTSNLIDIIERRWGNITIDRFASHKNRKSKRRRNRNSRSKCIFIRLVQ